MTDSEGAIRPVTYVLHSTGMRQRRPPNKLLWKTFNRNQSRCPPLRSGATVYQSEYVNFYAVMGLQLWNCLPATINGIETFQCFNQRLKSLLVQIPINFQWSNICFKTQTLLHRKFVPVKIFDDFVAAQLNWHKKCKSEAAFIKYGWISRFCWRQGPRGQDFKTCANTVKEI